MITQTEVYVTKMAQTEVYATKMNCFFDSAFHFGAEFIEGSEAVTRMKASSTQFWYPYLYRLSTG